MNRAYSLIEIKSFDDDLRIIEGIASTPTVDRTGDIVEPDGMEVSLPTPLLWQHNNAEPIGHVFEAKATKDGIKIKAQLSKVTEAGKLKDLLDFAWQSIKVGLVRGLSVGFRPLEFSRIDSGLKFLRWELLELSAVTVPANAQATIISVKSIDQKLLAASGQKQPIVVRLDNLPGVSGTISTQNTKVKTMNITEQIKSFETTRQAKAARITEIMEKAAEEGLTLDAQQTEEYDGLEAEVKSIDEHLKRLDALEKSNSARAKPATAIANGDSTAASAMRSPAQVQIKADLPKGIEFARYAMCLGASKGDINSAFHIAKSRFADSPRIIATLKAALEAGTTTDATWAAPLVEYNQFAGDFVEFLRPQTIIGRFGNDGVPSLRRIPFNVNIRGQTTGGDGYWVGEADAKPLTKFEFSNVYLGWAKVANIAVLTQELMRFSNPSAEMLVRDALAQALIARLDTDFVDPAKALVANVSPASITNGVTAIPSQGSTAEDARCDIRALFATYIAANQTPINGVWIMSATTALSLSLMRNALGQGEFPGISMTGGTFNGLPVIVSEYVTTDSNGSLVILANASDIWLADDGQVVIDASREASLQMDTAPTMASAGGSGNDPVPTQVVSMFQTNSVALRAERWINWKKRRPEAVAVLSGVNWGACTS